MKTPNTSPRSGAAGLISSRFAHCGAAFASIAVTALLTLAGVPTSALAQAPAPALSVANENPNRYNCDVYRWADSTGHQRTAALSRNNAADPGGSSGGVLYQYRFTPAGTATERVVTGTGSHGYNGWGYVVNHYGNSAYVSTGTTGTYSRLFTGRHHAIHQFKLTYPINGISVTATIHWYFATGQDNPVYAITYDTSAAGPGGITSVAIDSRSPYGDMEFGGDGSSPNVSGVAWGDKYKFYTRDEPLTPQSRWDYTQPNTVPYTRMWITGPDAEMGAVQTLNWLQHNAGGSWFSNNWGHASENRVVGDGTTFGAWMMPANWQWPYQLDQYEMMDSTSPTNSKRCAWGVPFGAVGATTYDGYGYETQYSGHPYQSYSVAAVIGRHSTADVTTQTTRTERVLAATLAANTGTLTASGPGGAGRTDAQPYSKTGYDATYGVYELAADASGAFSTTLSSSGAIKNPTFRIRGLGGIPSQLSLDGAALAADQGYYASYDSATQSLWLTVATDWNGSHTLASGAGVPPSVSVSIAPTATTLVPGASTTFTASVTNAANTAVTWAVVETGGGTITTAGVYTAPATVGTYLVRATSVADPTKSATATVAVALAPPSVTSFQASPSVILAGQTTTLTWAAANATTLSISPSIGTVTGTSRVVAPAANTVYTLTATGPGGTATATAGVAVRASTTPTNFDYVYRSGLQGPWADSGWGATVNFAGTAPGRAGTAIDVHIPSAWMGLSLADIGPSWTATYHFISTVATIEFDLYIEPDSTGIENVLFVLGDGTKTVDRPKLIDYIPGWATMTTAQRTGHWFHVVVDPSSLHATFPSFYNFVFFKMTDTAVNPHFRLAEVRLGSFADPVPPSITLGTTAVDYDQLTLPFTTSESAIYRIEYGYGNYSQTLTGSPTAWATSHTAVLTSLTRGATLQYRIVAIDPTGNQGLLTGAVAISDPAPPTTATVTITADPANTHPISPWIYGANSAHGYSSIIRNLTLNRQGGNRWTAYNWENNASNAGSDWYFHNDDLLGASNTPGEAVRSVVAGDRTRSSASLFTVQMQGYVSADKNGDDVTTVPLATRLTTRFKQVVAKKPTATAGAFTLTPSTSDASVYMDEYVWAMNQKIPGLYSDPVTPSFLLLDNEPELWNSTHAEIQTTPIGVTEYINKAIALTNAIKDVAPEAKIFGPVHYGFNGIVNWQSATGFGFDANYWFTDKFLADMRTASTTAGRRLLDVYCFNWYSEAQAGNTRILALTSSTLTEAQIQAIVQSPRSLWDPTYSESSWITSWTGGPIRLLPRLKDKIAANWPGTELAITEWGNGGSNHIAGAIAVADNLGVFGQQGLFEASYWPLTAITATTFDIAGFKMYRDFDGALGTYGDICIPTVSSDTAKVSAYLSRDSVVAGRHVLVAINRSSSAQAVGFAGINLAGTARLFRLAGTSNTPAAIGTASVDLANWVLPLPAYSVTTVEITSATPVSTYTAWRAQSFTGADLASEAISGPLADPDAAGLSNFARYAFDLAPRGPVAAPTTLGTVSTGGQTYLTLSFERRASATGLSYTVEASTDLVTWTPVPGLTYTAGTPASITAQDTVAVGSATRRFLRVRLAAP